MNDSNIKVAKSIVDTLKEKKLIPENDNKVELKIANGTIKENDWKLIFEEQIRLIEKQQSNEIK